jgi:nucleoside 2-deoxyribosyltransferase
MREIYFAGSIRGGRGDQQLYATLIDHLQSYGHVLTVHVGDPQLTRKGEEHLTTQKIYQRDMRWLRKADVFVAEVTTPSLGVGYELGMAEVFGLPTLCLFRPYGRRTLSTYVSENKHFQVQTYRKAASALHAIDQFIQTAG